MGRKQIFRLCILITAGLTGFGCAKSSDETAAASSGKNLYFATGQCNSGTGITTLSSTLSSRMIAKVNLSSKVQSVVFDLAAEYQGGFFAPETGAQAIVDNGTSLLLLTENAINMGDRKIFSVPKSNPFNTVIYASDSNALTQTAAHITRSMVKEIDGSLLFSKSIAIEKIGSNVLRIPSGANPYINAPGTNGANICNTSITFMSNIAVLPPFTSTTNAGKIIFSHQGGTAGSNRLGIINKDGYTATTDCYAGKSVPSIVLANDTGVSGLVSMDTTGPSPTSMVYIPDTVTPTQGKLIVGYSSSVAANLNNGTGFNYGIVMYDVTDATATTATIQASGTGTVLYNTFSNVFGISAMTYDSTNKHLYVATASQQGVANQTTAAYGYKVEKFALDLTATTVPKLTLIRDNNKPFMDRSSFTRCITSMAIGD
ncbi:MAG: hypothetical protein ABL930_06825 [Pseudobdellovibrio sp.]